MDGARPAFDGAPADRHAAGAAADPRLAAHRARTRARHLSGFARHRPGAAQRGVDRPAWIPVLRGARGLGAAAVRLLRVGHRPRPADAVSIGRGPGARMPRRRYSPRVRTDDRGRRARAARDPIARECCID